MRTIAALLSAIGLLVHGGACFAQHGSDSGQCSPAYENHNQIDYGPLKVQAVEGTTIIEVGTTHQQGAAGACLVLFTEGDHKLLASASADSNGRFELKDIKPGRYRLVARSEGLCTANIPLQVVKPSGRRRGEIIVHFRARGVDTCSYGKLK